MKMKLKRCIQLIKNSKEKIDPEKFYSGAQVEEILSELNENFKSEVRINQKATPPCFNISHVDPIFVEKATRKFSIDSGFDLILKLRIPNEYAEKTLGFYDRTKIEFEKSLPSHRKKIAWERIFMGNRLYVSGIEYSFKF